MVECVILVAHVMLAYLHMMLWMIAKTHAEDRREGAMAQ